MAGSPRGRRMRISRRSTIGILSTATALLTLGLMSPTSSVASVTTEGSWVFYPGQTFSDVVSDPVKTTVYKTAVRPPINADGSSNWPAKRGVIPVQFDLLSAESTTTTTTREYDPPVWQSIGSDTDQTNDVTFALFTPSAQMTVADVTNLSATYTYTTGDCFGGSLRWTINTDAGNVYAYYGTPNGPDQGCSNGNSGSGANLITTGITADRFEVEGASSPVYRDYASAMTLAGARDVNWVQLVVDSGWKGDQRLNVSNVTVNDNTWVPKTSEDRGTTTIPTGPFTKTCERPDAKLRWVKDDNTPSGAVNEAQSIQPKDTGEFYRKVNCKYIYNLDVSSLGGPGSYSVYANINGKNVNEPAVFDLR